jgi:hypothetical protein
LAARAQWDLAMKTPVLIVLAAAFVLTTGSVLAMMNSACKSSRHAWCAPASTFDARMAHR